MIQDVFAAIPLGVLLAFTIGPVFFVLIETSVVKGFRAAMIFDIGVVLGDIFFILIAYFSTSKLLERLKDEPGLFIFGGIIMIVYGGFTYIKEKRDYNKKIDEEVDVKEVSRNNYFGLFFKGFLLNFINIGVLGFWLGIIIVFGPKLDMMPNRIIIFFATIIVTYLLTDAIKITLAKQLKNKLTPFRIHKLKRVISVVLMVFGIALMAQGIFPKEKEFLERKFELKQGEAINHTNSIKEKRADS
ncbi:Threonine/homoserine/homoserine lactone efflux protein [Pustulibacterium marinum]|uniref:Threonine/homoserine/homoserine lactone efflux protein n=1 Tax=Pustulibacterium marinum TaxID=1224947 RepID=A0A1I7ETD6_9FLAO|nr:LysE family transporter [Pustulibacterium marinum]SFU27173.1 Threonine/homoserine/homoserine lactone efflux protein [Pustulibacterium marinum]